MNLNVVGRNNSEILILTKLPPFDLTNNPGLAIYVLRPLFQHTP